MIFIISDESDDTGGAIKVIRVITKRNGKNHRAAYYANDKQRLIKDVGDAANPYIEEAGW